jgi:hypothetical protein
MYLELRRVLLALPVNDNRRTSRAEKKESAKAREEGGGRPI